MKRIDSSVREILIPAVITGNFDCGGISDASDKLEI
jgi:hypothetical protein